MIVKFYTCRSNPWPNECLPRMKCTPQQCRTQITYISDSCSREPFATEVAEKLYFEHVARGLLGSAFHARQTLIWPRIWPASIILSTRTAPYLPVTAGVGLGFWVVPSSHMLKTEFLCHFCGKGFSGAAIRDIGYQLDSQWDLSHPTFNLSLIV